MPDDWNRKRTAPHAIAFAQKLRREATKEERILWKSLKQGQLEDWHFRRQHPVEPYIADFACLKAKLIIELDGSQHAENEHDRQRDEYLREKGWKVLRFWNNSVTENLQNVLETILNELRESASRPHPSPPPPGEGVS